MSSTSHTHVTGSLSFPLPTHGARPLPVCWGPVKAFRQMNCLLSFTFKQLPAIQGCAESLQEPRAGSLRICEDDVRPDKHEGHQKPRDVRRRTHANLTTHTLTTPPPLQQLPATCVVGVGLV